MIRHPKSAAVRFAARIRDTGKALARIPRFLRDPRLAQTYFPDQPRKSRRRVLLDLGLWAMRHAELNDYYFAYGLDLIGADPGRFMGIQEGKDLIKKVNSRAWSGAQVTDYRCLCKDKFLFGEYLAGLGFPTPKVLALYDGSQISWRDDRTFKGLESVPEHEGLDVFCKHALGAHGQDIFPLRVEKGHLLLDGAASSLDGLRKKLPVPGLFQERLVQHPALARFYPQAVNTFRLVTILRDREAFPFKGFVRFGFKGSRVDNWGAGGPAVAVDLTTGKLRARGVLMPGRGASVTSHPETGIRFEGFEIPFFERAVSLATELHRFFYGLVTVGWDIAITPTGPAFIEGNNGWEIFALQAIAGGLKGELHLDARA